MMYWLPATVHCQSLTVACNIFFICQSISPKLVRQRKPEGNGDVSVPPWSSLHSRPWMQHCWGRQMSAAIWEFTGWIVYWICLIVSPHAWSGAVCIRHPPYLGQTHAGECISSVHLWQFTLVAWGRDVYRRWITAESVIHTNVVFTCGSCRR